MRWLLGKVVFVKGLAMSLDANSKDRAVHDWIPLFSKHSNLSWSVESSNRHMSPLQNHSESHHVTNILQ